MNQILAKSGQVVEHFLSGVRHVTEFSTKSPFSSWLACVKPLNLGSDTDKDQRRGHFHCQHLQLMCSHDISYSRHCIERVFKNKGSGSVSVPLVTPMRDAGSATGKPDGLPDMDRLLNVQNLMVEQIPKIFSSRHEYRIYIKDLVFENYWDVSHPYRIVGITSYAIKVLKARLYMHSKYARVKVEVISSSIHEDLGCVCVRWRVGGLPQMNAFMFWKYVPFRIKKTANKQLEWTDGLSTFFVNEKGFIFKHRIDRVIPDRKDSAQKEEKKSELEVGPLPV